MSEFFVNMRFGLLARIARIRGMDPSFAAALAASRRDFGRIPAAPAGAAARVAPVILVLSFPLA